MELSIAIVEDNCIDAELLKGLLAQYATAQNYTIHTEYFSSGETFLDAFQKDSFHLIFLDIYMSGCNGMDVAKQIRQLDTHVPLIFTTSSPDFAIEGYMVQASAYFLKPIEMEQLTMVLNQCLVSNHLVKPHVTVKENRCMIKIPLDDVLYIDVDNHYVQIHTATHIHRTYMKFRDFVPSISQYEQFLRCYRNIIVNMDHVVELDDVDFVMSNRERIPMKRNAKLEMRQRYADYIFHKMK